MLTLAVDVALWLCQHPLSCRDRRSARPFSSSRGLKAQLPSQDQEHTLVLKTLEPMPSDRKCYRLIGGVLVQQTVADVRPAVESNAENLKQARTASAPMQPTECAHAAADHCRALQMVQTLTQRLEQERKKLLDFQVRQVPSPIV